MSLRLVALTICMGSCLACGEGVSQERCEQWDASVREVVANVESALPSDVKRRSYDENYRFVADDLELSQQLADCLAEGYLTAEASEPAEEDPAPDIAFLDAIEFGVDPKQAAGVMRDAGWACKAVDPPDGFEGKAHACTGSYAKGKAEVLLAFRAGRLAEVSLAVRDIPKRIEDIVTNTGADVFAARKALIEKAVADLGTRFDDLMKTQDQVGDDGVRMVWKGSDGSRRAQLEFAEKGPSLGFAVQDDAVARELAGAIAHPAKKAESYFE